MPSSMRTRDKGDLVKTQSEFHSQDCTFVSIHFTFEMNPYLIDKPESAERIDFE